MKFSIRHILSVLFIIVLISTISFYFLQYQPALQDDEVPSPETFLPFEYYNEKFSH